MKNLSKLSLLLLVGWLVATHAAYAAGQADQPITVILVRHAERADDSADSALSPAGRNRADLLARMLSDCHPDALYATVYRRTQQTLQPLADAVGLPISVLPSASVDQLVDQARSQNPGGVVVIASHSDKVPTLVERLTGKSIVPLGHNEYSRLYILYLTGPGRGQVLELHFGNPDPQSSPKM